MAVTKTTTAAAAETPADTPTHPALDDPRAGTTEVQNRIDLNDPTRPGAEVVADATRVD